jgi:predicted PurR-regulated permease PerM
MPTTQNNSLYQSLVKAIAFAAGLIIFLWFLYKAAGVVILLLFALVLAIVVNAPVAKLEAKGIKRIWASLIVFASILLVIVLLSWLVIPKISDQVTVLINNLPGYANQLSKNVSSWFKNYPEISKNIQQQGLSLSEWAPSLTGTLMRLGNFSLTLLSIILIGILFISMVIYAVINPRPLLQLYFSFFPSSKQKQATTAFQNASIMIVGRMKANIIGGAIRAVCITIFLSIMGVPGAFVWGALAFFSELIPRLGFYMMSIPPILVALSISTTTALWVAVFMIALDEVMADVVFPMIRSNTMNIHPVSIIFIVLAMTAAFGIMGAFLATPLTAIIKAFYESFFTNRFKENAQMETQIDAVMYKPADLVRIKQKKSKDGSD